MSIKDFLKQTNCFQSVFALKKLIKLNHVVYRIN